MTFVNDLLAWPLDLWILFIVANVAGVWYFCKHGASLKGSIVSMMLVDAFMFWMSYQV